MAQGPPAAGGLARPLRRRGAGVRRHRAATVLMADAATTARAAAIDFARQVAEFWDGHLGEGLAGVYLIGSLAHGGYNARYSDIDVALVTEQSLQSGALDLAHARASAYSATLASELALFWPDPAFSSGRFPPLDRIDYLDHAVTLIERRRLSPPRPTLSGVREYLGGDPFRRWSQNVMHLSTLDEL